MLYDLTSLQRDANTRFGFSARRTLAAAQRLYEEHKALTYPRTNSRFLTTDMAGEIKPIAELVGARPEYAAAARYVTSLDVLPLARVIDDAKVTDHHAIIPTNAEHPVDKMDGDDLRVYDLVVRRFLAVFHPDAVLENTRVETTVAEPRLPHPRPGAARAGLARRLPRRGRGAARRRRRRATTTSRARRSCRGSSRASRSRVLEVESLAKETKPPRRYSDASLLGAMETAGKLRRRRGAARGDEGLRHRHAGDARRDHRAADRRRLRRARRPLAGRDREGPERDPPARRARADLARPDRRLGAAARRGSSAARTRASASCTTSPASRKETVEVLDETLKDVRIPRATLGPCPVCGHEIVENRKGYSCWGRRTPAAAS